MRYGPPRGPKTISLTMLTLWCHYTPTQRRQLYEWLLTRMTDLGAPPHKIGFKAPGHPGKWYKTYKRMQNTFEALDFATVEHFELHRGPPDSGLEPAEFDIAGSVARKNRGENDWSAMLSVTPSTLGVSEEEAVQHLIDFAGLTVQRYGFIFYMAREDGPGFVAWGITYQDKHGRTEEEYNNLAAWGHYRSTHEKHILLRDIYPVSFLSRPYLDLPVFGTTLERWIRKDAARGSLQPLPDNERVSVWRPVIENIPQIREQLFSAGALFYYKFFQHWEPDNPWKRDFSKPFALPDEPIPEIFTPAFYAGRDPKITR